MPAVTSAALAGGGGESSGIDVRIVREIVGDDAVTALAAARVMLGAR